MLKFNFIWICYWIINTSIVDSFQLTAIYISSNKLMILWHLYDFNWLAIFEILIWIFFKWTLKRIARKHHPLKLLLPKIKTKFTLYFYVHTTFNIEIKDTLTLLDKAVANKETRTISRITKNVRKYRKVISAHHLIAVFEALGW